MWHFFETATLFENWVHGLFKSDLGLNWNLLHIHLTKIDSSSHAFPDLKQKHDLADSLDISKNVPPENFSKQIFPTATARSGCPRDLQKQVTKSSVWYSLAMAIIEQTRRPMAHATPCTASLIHRVYQISQIH